MLCSRDESEGSAFRADTSAGEIKFTDMPICGHTISFGSSVIPIVYAASHISVKMHIYLKSKIT
jgi:hypothetical protein